MVERWPSQGRGNEYHLTPAGQDLEQIIDAFGRWAVEWLFDELYPHEVDPHTLMWWMHRRIDRARFPDRRVVLEFVFTAPDPMTIWLVLDRGEVSVCLQHPGFDTDVLLRATTATFSDVFNGPLHAGPTPCASGAVEVSGHRSWSASCRPGSCGARGPRWSGSGLARA